MVSTLARARGSGSGDEGGRATTPLGRPSPLLTADEVDSVREVEVAGRASPDVSNSGLRGGTFFRTDVLLCTGRTES